MTGGGPNQEMLQRGRRIRREIQTIYKVPENKLVGELEKYTDNATVARILSEGLKTYRGRRRVDGQIFYRVPEDKFDDLLKTYGVVDANKFLNSLVTYTTNPAKERLLVGRRPRH